MCRFGLFRRQRKDRQRTAEIGVVGKLLVTAHRAEAVSVLFQACRQADSGPAANARIDADELLVQLNPEVLLVVLTKW